MSYQHLTSIERGKLDILLGQGFSTRQIGKQLNRHHSSVAREVKRNSENGIYYAENANVISTMRNSNSADYTKFTPELAMIIEEKLFATWSPEQISYRALKGEICTKTIYRWLYLGKIVNGNLLVLRHKGKRQKSPEKRGIFSNGVSISERSQEANDRSEFGHWELDTMVSSRGKSKGCFSTFIERKSRLYVAYVGQDRTAQTMENAIKQLYNVVPYGAFKSATTDRGKEFACHEKIKQQLNIPVYFADAYAPWQRGSNENANGLLREFYPKKTDLIKVSQKELRHKLELINNRPRKCLGWKTSIETFLQEVSHLS